MSVGICSFIVAADLPFTSTSETRSLGRLLNSFGLG